MSSTLAHVSDFVMQVGRNARLGPGHCLIEETLLPSSPRKMAPLGRKDKKQPERTAAITIHSPLIYFSAKDVTALKEDN